jgi:hypothetical protein
MVLRQCALDGAGVVLLCGLVDRRRSESGRLMDLFPHYVASPTNFQTAISAVYPSRKQVPRKVKLLVEYMEPAAADARALQRTVTRAGPLTISPMTAASRKPSVRKISSASFTASGAQGREQPAARLRIGEQRFGFFAVRAQIDALAIPSPVAR